MKLKMFIHMHQGSGLPMKLVTIIELIKPEVQYHVMRYALNKTGWGIFYSLGE